MIMDRLDLQELPEDLVCPANKVYLELVPLARWDLKVQEEMLVFSEYLDQLERQAHLVIVDRLVQLGILEHQDQQDLLAVLEYRDHAETQDTVA